MTEAQSRNTQAPDAEPETRKSRHWWFWPLVIVLVLLVAWVRGNLNLMTQAKLAATIFWGLVALSSVVAQEYGTTVFASLIAAGAFAGYGIEHRQVVLLDER